MAHGGRHYFWVDTISDLQVSSGGNNSTSLLGGIPTTESRSGMTLIRLVLCYSIQYLLHDSGEGQQKFSIPTPTATPKFTV